MVGLKLSFLGSPQIKRGDEPLEISASKALALLVYLAITQQNHSRDTLGTLLWPDNDQSQARTYLRHALWSLKKEVGERWLYTSREQIGFQSDEDVWLDVAVFREELTAVATHDHTPGQMCPDCLEHLQEAVSLCRDNFLAGFTLPDSPAFDEWQFFQSEELRQMLAGALEELVAEHSARQEYDSAIAYARRWLSLDPLHEPVHRTLMRLYALAGQQSAAARQYQECVRLLDEELGVEPDTETTTLYETIRTRQFGPSDLAEAAEVAVPLPLAERYLMKELLAAGAHGEVYRGQDVQTGESIIIKRLRPDAVKKDKKLVARFLQEAEALRQLNHPNIVRLLATFEQNGQQHLVMEYVPGGSLAQMLQQQSQLPLNGVLDIALELADALARAHHLNIIHRDVKPENVLLAVDGTPRLTDFGVARLLKKDGRLTETGALLGSPAYMSPELLQGDNPDARSDVWSFGVLLFEMLAGQRPFLGEQIAAVLVSILNDPIPDVRQLRPEVPPALANLLQRMLVKEPSGRIASVRQVAATLEAVRHDIQSGKGAGNIVEVGLGKPLLTETLPPLPAQPVAFVGRELEQDDLKRSLQNPVCRLLTIIGPGGMGKTRLALALAEDSRSWFPDGVYFVPLTSLHSAEDIIATLSNMFGLQLDNEDDLLAQLLRYLRYKHLLLVLDNFEHLLQEANVVAAILKSAPQIKIVVTSRERLVLSSEVIYPLTGLRFPDQERVDKTNVHSYSAVQLLLQRAAAVRQNVEADTQSLIHIVRICQMVGGMPLALVLAASWLDVLSFEEVADEISRNLDFLATEMSDVLDRQRSMRAVFDTSWKRLTADEQQVLMDLTVFRGGFMREAAQAITPAGSQVLRKLVNKSLLVVAENGRFDMHELLRQYIQEQLQTSPAVAHQARSQHASYYAAFLDSLEGHLRSKQQQKALAMLEAELENIRAVWHWLVQQKQWETIIYQILPALFGYCELRFKAVYLWPLLEEAQKGLLDVQETDTDQFLFVLLTAKSAFFYTGITNRLKVDNEPKIGKREAVLEAWQLRESVTDRRNLRWQILLAFFYGQLVSPEEGIRTLLDLLPDSGQETGTWESGLALQNLGQLYLLTNEQQAESCLTGALDIFQRIGDAYESGITLYLFGLLFVHRQQLAEAQANFLLVQQNFSREEDFAIFALINWELANVYIGQGEPEKAFECLRQSFRMFLDRGVLRSALSFLSRESYESLRYGTIEHALETREECLALVAEADDPLGEPWYIWEMGEIYRVKGDLKQARQWYDRAFAAFKKTQDHYDTSFFHQGMAFYHRGLGNIALAQNKAKEAQEHLQESLKMAEASGHQWIKAYALADLGRAALLLGQSEAAQQYLVQALKQTKQISNGGMALVALAGVVLHYTIQERWDEANELGLFVLNHPLTWQETKSQVTALLDDSISASKDLMTTGEEEWLWLDMVDQQIALLQAESVDTAVLAAPTLANKSLFVAREQELARLDEMLHTALNGQSRVAFILGETGQGKTALLQAFAHRAQEMHPDLIAVGGSCNAFTGLGDPYLPFREILSLLTADLEAQSLVTVTESGYVQRIKQLLPATAQALVKTAPDLIDTFVPLAGLLERTAVPSLANKAWRQQLLTWANTKLAGPDTNLQQNALLDQYARLLQALARQAPLLLILDDLQWADPGSVALLFHLGRRLSGSRIFIVGAYRPDEVALGQDNEAHPLARVVNELQRIFGDILIDLGQAQGQAFIDAWLDNEPNRLEEFFRQTLYRQTGGHPLFTIELLRAMRERGDLQQDEDGVWEVQTRINWNTLPARVEGAIGERIKRLEPSLQELLQVASVEGDEFTAEVVAGTLQLDERETVRLLSRELDKVHALVRAIGTRRIGKRRLSRYRFRHILIQRYLYNLLDDVQRIYQHEAVGSALETLHKEQVSEVAVQLARHFEIAQLPEKAAVYLYLAGDQARRAAALQEAIRHYQAALSQWPGDDEAGRADLLRKLGECQWMTGHADDALKTLETGYNLFQAFDNFEEAGAIQRLIGRVYWELGNRKKSLHHYHRALSILEPISDSVELAWAISSISQMHMNADEFDQAIVWGERALTLARRLDAKAVIAHALNNVGSSHLNMGRVDQGRQMLQESIRLALDGNLPHDAGRGRLNLGEALASRDYYEEALEIFAALYEQASRVHTTLYAGSAIIELARIDWLNGRWRPALARTSLINKWVEEGQSMAYLHVIASTVFGQQYNDLGQFEAAYKMLKSTLSKVRSFDELQLMSPHLTQMIRALAAFGKDVEAKQVARELLAKIVRAACDSRDSPQPIVNLCDALPASVFVELFDDIVDTLQHLEQDNENRRVPSRHAAMHEARGVLALYQEDQGQALASFRQAVELWGMVERPYDQVRALKKLGETLMLAGEETAARAAFTQGNKLIGELAVQLDDEETKAIFLQSPLVQAIQNGLHNLKT